MFYFTLYQFWDWLSERGVHPRSPGSRLYAVSSKTANGWCGVLIYRLDTLERVFDVEKWPPSPLSPQDEQDAMRMMGVLYALNNSGVVDHLITMALFDRLRKQYFDTVCSRRGEYLICNGRLPR